MLEVKDENEILRSLRLLEAQVWIEDLPLLLVEGLVWLSKLVWEEYKLFRGFEKENWELVIVLGMCVFVTKPIATIQ